MSDQIEKNEMGGACSTYGREETRGMVGKRKGKRPLGRLRHRWEDITNMDLQEVGWGNELVNTVLSFWVP